MVLDLISCLNDRELTEQERAVAGVIIFYEDFNDIEDVLACEPSLFQELVSKMFWFISCDSNSGGVQLPYKVIDWDADAQLVCSAINKVAHTEVRAVEYLHWWTFIGYYMEIGESVLSTVVSIRSKMKKGKKLEKWEREFKASNPNYFIWDARTAQELEDEELIKSIWNSDKW